MPKVENKAEISYYIHFISLKADCKTLKTQECCRFCILNALKVQKRQRFFILKTLEMQKRCRFRSFNVFEVQMRPRFLTFRVFKLRERLRFCTLRVLRPSYFLSTFVPDKLNVMKLNHIKLKNELLWC